MVNFLSGVCMLVCVCVGFLLGLAFAKHNSLDRLSWMDGDDDDVQKLPNVKWQRKVGQLKKGMSWDFMNVLFPRLKSSSSQKKIHTSFFMLKENCQVL